MSDIRPSSSLPPMLGRIGVTEVSEGMEAKVPPLPRMTPTCGVSKQGPNRVPFGRLIYEHGLKLEEWSRENDLILVDKNGDVVETNIAAFCPIMESGPRINWRAEMARGTEWESEIARDV